MKIYVDSNKLCHIDGDIYPKGFFRMNYSGVDVSIICLFKECGTPSVLFKGPISLLEKEDGIPYLNYEELSLAIIDFFVEAPTPGGTSNPFGTSYIKGDENTDGSLRFTANTDNTITAEERIDGIWIDSAIRGNLLFAGRNANLKAIGDILHIDAFGGHYLIVQSEYDNNGSKHPRTPIVGAKEIRIISTVDESGELIGNNVSYSITPTVDQIIDKIYYKTGSVAATEDIVWTAFPTNDPTGLYVKRVIPASQWIANTELSFDFESFGLLKDVSFTGHLESIAPFSIKTDVGNIIPWRASDRWLVTYNNIANTPPWSPKIWNKDEWCIENGWIYVCNRTENQSGSFASNSANWDIISDLISRVIDYQGGITVEIFNALVSGVKGYEYKFTNSGTLVGGQSVNSNDTVDIITSFTGRAITNNDYSFYPSPSDVVLQSGRSGGQEIAGGALNGEDLTLISTKGITKGKINFGESFYNEATNKLHIRTISPLNGTTDKELIFDLDSFDNAAIKFVSSGASNFKIINIGASGISFQGFNQGGDQVFNFRTYGNSYHKNSLGIGGEAENSTILNLISTTKGFKVPSMTKIQRLALSPIEGLEVYQIDNGPGKYCFTNNNWDQVGGLTYQHLYRTTDVVGVTVNTDIGFIRGEGNITTSSPDISLKAGKVYWLECFFSISGSSLSNIVEIKWVESSTNISLVNLSDGLSIAVTSNDRIGTQPSAGGIYSPTSDISVKVRFISVTGTTNLDYKTFRIIIKQIK